MRNRTWGQVTENYYNNEVTQAIEVQPLVAPQYGIMGQPPQYDPTPPQKPRKGRSRHQNVRTGKKSMPASQARAYDPACAITRDLKLDLKILREFLALANRGRLDVSRETLQAMRKREQAMAQVMGQRDLRDIAKRQAQQAPAPRRQAPRRELTVSVGEALTRAVA